jgi:hypothetical protein
MRPCFGWPLNSCSPDQWMNSSLLPIPCQTGHCGVCRSSQAAMAPGPIAALLAPHKPKSMLVACALPSGLGASRSSPRSLISERTVRATKGVVETTSSTPVNPAGNLVANWPANFAVCPLLDSRSGPWLFPAPGMPLLRKALTEMLAAEVDGLPIASRCHDSPRSPFMKKGNTENTNERGECWVKSERRSPRNGVFRV